MGKSPVTPASLRSKWSSLRALVASLPSSPATLQVTLSDARALPCEDSEVDLILTSPPYINVFNYHQQYRQSVESLDWDILPLARSEIGANRKHRGNRFLTVTQYCLDMAQVLLELERVCKPGARAIVVVGRESTNVRKPAFLQRCASTELGRVDGIRGCSGARTGFSPIALASVFSRTSSIFAWIKSHPLHLSILREISAERTLGEAKARAPSESRQDLYDALARIDQVEPSPLAAPAGANARLASGFFHTPITTEQNADSSPRQARSRARKR